MIRHALLGSITNCERHRATAGRRCRPRISHLEYLEGRALFAATVDTVTNTSGSADVSGSLPNMEEQARGDADDSRRDRRRRHGERQRLRDREEVPRHQAAQAGGGPRADARPAETARPLPIRWICPLASTMVGDEQALHG